MSDPDINSELRAMKGNDDLIEDAFYRRLEFGTVGLRGVIGAGTNRMNIYTVAGASQGLANHIIKSNGHSVAISYDSRIKSGLFAETAAGVFAANGIKVYIYDRLMPTPCLSYAVRELSCAAGVMITASHNPAEYNGYKVYASDGCQITAGAAKEILGEIERTDIFEDVKSISFEDGLKKRIIDYISEGVYNKYIKRVKKEAFYIDDDTAVDRNVSIAYTPLNGRVV